MVSLEADGIIFSAWSCFIQLFKQ